MFRKFILFAIVFLIMGSAAFAFSDLPVTHKDYSCVTNLVEKYEVISGYPDNTFCGDKILNRYEFAKALVASLNYIETTCEADLKAKTTRQVFLKDVKTTYWAYPYVMDLVSKYQIISGFPDGTFKGKNKLNRYQFSVAMANAVKRVEKVSGISVEVEEIVLPGVSSNHWAYTSLQKLIFAKIISVSTKEAFNGKELVNRYELASVLDKFIDFSVTEIKAPPLTSPPAPVSTSTATFEPRASVSGGWGNICENASGTNNWGGLDLAVSYGNIFKIWKFAGNYEVSGKYGFNQINYIVPKGTGVQGGVVNENRYQLELNTIYPVVGFYGINGKLLLGMKYINLSNATAPTSFTGLNLGVETSIPVLERTLLTRLSYSYPLIRGALTTSILGQPSQLFDYEFSLGAEMFSYPVLFGIGGEIMAFSGGSTRYYNNFFIRYFLL